MIPINPDSKVEILAGPADLEVAPMAPYSESVIGFLSDFSTELQKHGRDFPDVAALAFWCRKGNLTQLQQKLQDDYSRTGRGLAFHIAPSNVPVNFAFSWIFGLVSGNSNIVRLPSREFPQVDLIGTIAKELMSRPEHKQISRSNALIRYSVDDEITARFFADADVRLFWGGDQTIHHLRSLPAQPHVVDVAFADRYSISVLGAEAVNDMDDKELKALAVGFYNDTYLMDQNACSSPHLVLWVGKGHDSAKKRFWSAVAEEVEQKYQMEPIQNVDKYTLLSKNLMQGPDGLKASLDSPYLYRVEVPEITKQASDLRGLFGLFFEGHVPDLKTADVLQKIVTKKYQTVTYFGVEPKEIAHLVQEGHLPGIDRVVPVGKALDIGVYWDGFDIVRTLSRVIYIQ